MLCVGAGLKSNQLSYFDLMKSLIQQWRVYMCITLHVQLIPLCAACMLQSNCITNDSNNGLSPDGLKHLPEPILTYCQLDLNSVKFNSKHKNLHSWKCTWKCRLRNDGHFIQGEMRYCGTDIKACFILTVHLHGMAKVNNASKPVMVGLLHCMGT